MRAARFDQYEFPSFRLILTSLGLWCVALMTPLPSCHAQMETVIIDQGN